MSRSAARLKIAKDDPERTAKLSAFEARFSETFGVKRQATGERDIKVAFPNLTPAITNPLAQNVYANYKAHKADVVRGRRTIDYYKSVMPIPVAPGRISFLTGEKGHIQAVVKLARHA